MVSIRWRDKMFRARVEEEQNDWIPDCLIDEEDVSEESGSMEVRLVADDDDSGDRNMVTGEDVLSQPSSDVGHDLNEETVVIKEGNFAFNGDSLENRKQGEYDKFFSIWSQ
ncbi:hypothetical protein Hanom_Chr17g01542051 [Helianthus anomalus]